MDNVPSSAILAIVAIVLACLFAAFAFSAVQSQKTSGSNAMVKVEGMNTELDESDLTQYDGQILTGSQVVEAIKKLKDTEGVIVSTTDRAGHFNVYGNNVSGTDAADGAEDNHLKPEIKTIAIDGNSLYGAQKTAAQKPGSGKDVAATQTGDVVQTVNTTTLKLMGDKNSSSHYVTPSQKFRGTVHRNTTTNSIDWIEFTQE